MWNTNCYKVASPSPSAYPRSGVVERSPAQSQRQVSPPPLAHMVPLSEIAPTPLLRPGSAQSSTASRCSRLCTGDIKNRTKEGEGDRYTSLSPSPSMYIVCIYTYVHIYTYIHIQGSLRAAPLPGAHGGGGGSSGGRRPPFPS